MDIFILLVLAAFFCGFTMCLAEAKGLSLGMWAIAGFLFGPIALLAAVGMPDKKLHRFLKQFAEHQGIEPKRLSEKSMDWSPVSEAWPEPKSMHERKPRDPNHP